MSTTVRDPRADARQAATEQVLDADVAAVRRRLRQRWNARMLLTTAALAVVVVGLPRLIGPSLDDVRWLPSGSLWLGTALAGPLPVLFPALLVWQVVRAAREQVRARQARRWLGLHA